MVANSPPSSADLLHKGYPSFPVLDTNARRYRSEHFPSIMHSEFGFSVSYFSSQLYTNPYWHRNRVFQHILHHQVVRHSFKEMMDMFAAKTLQFTDKRQRSMQQQQMFGIPVRQFKATRQQQQSDNSAEQYSSAAMEKII
ncbi:unnamed protein product [Onchocerca ochengi]|uniref:Uncharacterized protein n=1 Tax=Onchocerca ochengi TaxID=42157 RepID=A0A182EQ43_ONCOC|nr:unnamed protein product [Onchocerca ochengi]